MLLGFVKHMQHSLDADALPLANASYLQVILCGLTFDLSRALRQAA